MGILAASKRGYVPNPDGWLPQPLVEDRSQFGMHAITSSPLMLSFNVTNTTLLQLVWDIISNEEAIAINQDWAGSPGRLVATLPASSTASSTAFTSTPSGAYTQFQGQLGRYTGWGRKSQPSGSYVPSDTDAEGPHYMLLRLAHNMTLADAEGWCTSQQKCAGFSYRSPASIHAARAAPRAFPSSMNAYDNAISTTVPLVPLVPLVPPTAAPVLYTVYFKDASQLFWMDANFKSNGPIRTSPPWLSHVKKALVRAVGSIGVLCAGEGCG
jgi:hypothetical protein